MKRYVFVDGYPERDDEAGEWVPHTEYAALQQQLAAAREALAEMTADRDSWCEQAAARVNDWHEARVAMQAAEADAARYRFLRDQNANIDNPDAWTITCCDFTDVEGPSRYWVGSDLDAAIDATLQRDR